MEPITSFTTKTVVIPSDNIDTDQIIPARFLKVTTKLGLGKQLFCDWRYDSKGAPKADFILNTPAAQGAKVLIAGDNFGCGSSREHAPWALTDYGFRAVVSTSIADIFKNNSLKNGLIPIVVDTALHQRLLNEPGIEVTVDLNTRTLSLSDGTKVTFPIDPFSRHCLMNGVDELGYLQAQDADISAYERSHS
jgi:3-isopropylmalate/(R)-2-methylmalate dehydratase small subunit